MASTETSAPRTPRKILKLAMPLALVAVVATVRKRKLDASEARFRAKYP